MNTYQKQSSTALSIAMRCYNMTPAGHLLNWMGTLRKTEPYYIYDNLSQTFLALDSYDLCSCIAYCVDPHGQYTTRMLLKTAPIYKQTNKLSGDY